MFSCCMNTDLLIPWQEKINKSQHYPARFKKDLTDPNNLELRSLQEQLEQRDRLLQAQHLEVTCQQ